MEDSALKLLGAGVAMIGSLGAGIGIGLIFSAYLNAIARNPSLENKLRTMTYIGAAFAEFVFLGCMMIAFVLLFVVK